MTSSGYKTSRTINNGTEFEQKKIFLNLEISNFGEDLETSNSATNIIKQGNYFENLLNIELL